MGPRDDWFRRTSWTESEQSEFEKRLARARPHGRTQYLRIQAWTLVETGDTELVKAGLVLAERFLVQYPEDLLAAWVHVTCAEAHEKLGEVSMALASYRKAIEAERKLPNVVTNGAIGFSWLVTRRALVSLYSEAESLLLEFPTNNSIIPVHRYRYHAIRAVIAAAKGYASQAREDATLALETASATHSGISRHPTVGLVDPSDELIPRLRAIAL
jgi:hypothetical protein